MKHFYLLLVAHYKEIIVGLKGPNSFVRNVAYNLSGNTIVLVIGFLLTPVIARIYGPEAYGEFALFIAICNLIISFATLQLPAGYVAAKNRAEFFVLVRISFISLFVISLLSLITILLIQQFDKSGIQKMYFFIPLFIFFLGLYHIIRGWNIKLQEFKKSAKAKVFGILFGKSSTLLIGIFYTQSAIGIIVGSIVAFVVESINIVSKKMFIEAWLIIKQKVSYSFYIKTLSKFRQYPTYLTFNSIVNSLSAQLPIYFIASEFTKDKVGLFTLSLSLIQIPLTLFGTSIGAVFLPKISRIINQEEIRNSTIINLYKKVFYPGIILLLLLAFLLGSLLTVILGDEWQGTSFLSSFMATSFSFGLIALPLSVVYRLINFEKVNLKLTSIFIILKIAGLVIGGAIGDFSLTVFIYFFVTLIHNGAQVLTLFKKLNIKLLPIVRDFVLVIIIYVLSYLMVN